ncbi:MAG: RNA polymerase factor sigma-54 [Desulfobulbaceae bacterium]|uniref:RNA polymerase factor sigma-54 n=1 Tax=Candidatus Desulfatifera sulfidica TaxID=2841691 RepID=A0A8J6NB10_9BACT|nr:RNA polymerase factor sigma-54 [Candidatus Desulfatifera sulfidica]
MALELKQQMKLSQKLVMTPQLRQAIKLLQLNRLELSDALQAEMEQNPALEEDFEYQELHENPISLSTTTESGQNGAESPVTSELSVASDTLPDTNWEDYANTFDSNFSFSRETPAADAPSQFDFISEKPGLLAHVRWQLAHSDLDAGEKEIAMFIAGNLNRYGFLEIELDEILTQTGCDRDEAEYVLEVIQDMDPSGIGARDVSESLVLQLERLGMGDSLAAEIVRHHLDHLQTRNYKIMARALGCRKPEIMRAVDFITSELTPYPGLAYNQEAVNYVVPDVYVRKIDGEFVIYLNEDDLPKLKLSSVYLELLRDEQVKDKGANAYIKDKVRNAEWFIKSIYQRQRTIYRTMESILHFQRDFFERGAKYLRPLILRDVAEDIGMHESTISRVTSNKYVDCPQGIFELKYFFSTALSRGHGEDVAAESIRERLRVMIQEEDPYKPLSDNALSKMLAERDIQVARRTVAKYREQLKILPVKHRRKPRR